MHIIGAHLKSRLRHYRYNQTDMRRYESRLLRRLLNEIHEKDGESNVLVLGDLNDVYSANPVSILRSPDSKNQPGLFDLRPADSMGLIWTHWWDREDIYGRVDYALSNRGLLPEIELEESRIVHILEKWDKASDHRPLLISISASESGKMEKTLSSFKDQMRIIE